MSVTWTLAFSPAWQERIVGNYGRIVVLKRLCCLSMGRKSHENDGGSHILLSTARFSRAGRVTQSLATIKLSCLLDLPCLTELFVDRSSLLAITTCHTQTLADDAARIGGCL